LKSPPPRGLFGRETLGRRNEMALEHLLEVGEGIPAPEKIRRAANLQDLKGRARTQPRRPRGLLGPSRPGDSGGRSPGPGCSTGACPDHKWFLGAKCNITENALDRHADGPRRNHRAFICIDEDGTERSITYAELRDLVSRLASGLRSLGVGVASGSSSTCRSPSRASPRCSRWPASARSTRWCTLASGVGALRDRIVDAGAKVIIAGDVGFRAGSRWSCRASWTRR
jgi:acetyl-CoA synthetase